MNLRQRKPRPSDDQRITRAITAINRQISSIQHLEQVDVHERDNLDAALRSLRQARMQIAKFRQEKLP